MQPVLHTCGLPISLNSTMSDRARVIGGKEVIRSCHVTCMIQPYLVESSTVQPVFGADVLAMSTK